MSNPKLSALVDAFTAPTINTGLWNASTGGQYALDTVNDLVVLNVPTSAGSYNLGASGPYDATGSSLYAQITAAPVGNGGASVALKLDAGSNNYVLAQAFSGGVFQFKVVTAGTAATTTLPTYDPHQHRWWKLSESAGAFTVSTSPDGLNWTALATTSYSWNATGVQVYVQTIVTDTEPSGMTATIAHVNTPLGGQANPNWPLVEQGWGAHWAANGGDSPLDRYVDVTSRTRQTTRVQRGRQYELDQVRSGTLDTTLVNTDGVLDPINASGPFYGHIQPYQPYRVRAQWPPTRNLLSQAQATGGDLGGQPLGAINAGNSGPSIFTDTDSTFGSIVSSATAWRGSEVLQFAVPTSVTAPANVCYTPQPAFQPGATYTHTMQARNVTAATTVQVYAALVWLDTSQHVISTAAGTTTTLTGSATASWTGLTVTGTAPPNAAMVYASLQVAAAPASTVSVQVDGWQVERGSQASAWCCPGTWYPVYGGFTERWPSSWNMAGTYGLVTPTAVDAFALLSQRMLQDPLFQEINSHSPRFLYTLGDPQGSATFADSTGKNPAAPWQTSKYGAGSLTSGNQITSATGGGTYTGSSNTVVTINNPNPGTNIIGGASFISLNAAGITGPANPSGSWTRMFAFRYTGPVPTTEAVLWSCFSRTSTSGARLFWQIDTNSKLGLIMGGPSSGSGALFIPVGPTVVDSNWHLAIASYSHASALLTINLDGASSFWGSFDPTLEATGLVSDNVGGWVDPTVGNGTAYNYKGDVSFVAEFPTALSSTDMVNMYAAWKNSCAGDSTDQRYARILNWGGYIGPKILQTGLTTSMGPAATAGQDVLAALQSVVDTENGEHFVDRQGFVQFRSRSARYNAMTPAVVFGENTGAGEIPYEDCQLDYDPTHLSNLVQITQASTNQIFKAQDATSQANYFPRSLTRTINSSSASECQDAAGYLLSRYRQPATRVSSIKLHPSANPVLWPMLLGLELGTRVRVMRRPPAPAPPIQVECFVEQIQWDLSDSGEAFVTLQCSPADLTPYAIFSAFHCTLNGSPAAGATTITINAGSDNQNPAAAQIGQGQQLVLGQNTANQETVTVLSVSATSPGWTTAVITLQAATTKSHSNNDLVCEPLPAGVTDPTTYDVSATFDATSFAY